MLVEKPKFIRASDASVEELKLNALKIPELENQPTQASESVQCWPEVKEKLLKCLDFDIKTKFGNIQISTFDDGCFQIIVFGEGPQKSINNIHYYQERTTVYNLDKEGQLTSSDSELLPYQWDDAFGPEYMYPSSKEAVPYSLETIIDVVKKSDSNS
jgi:hypothetical protein